MPTGSPVAAPSTAPARRPLAITVGIPAAVAISAATTFDRIPPEPRGEVACPIRDLLELLELRHLRDEPGGRDRPRVRREQALGVG